MYGTSDFPGSGGTLYSVRPTAPYDHQVHYQFSKDEGDPASPPVLRAGIYGVHGFGTTVYGKPYGSGSIYEVFSPSPFLPPGQEKAGQ
jgi:hypothetical protein